MTKTPTKKADSGAFTDLWFAELGVADAEGVVVAAGGASDIVLARCLAERAIGYGARRVDIAQPLGCRTFSSKGIMGEALNAHGLEEIPGVDPDSVLRHNRTVPNGDAPMKLRGKGIRVSAALDWESGERLVVAGIGDGMRVLAGRPWAPDRPYDFALAVDGGGDVLTHDHTEFDRVVVDALAATWSEPRRLGLVAMGLGADGGSSPTEFVDACPPGWRHHATATMDSQLADAMQAGLERANCWNPRPATWDVTDPEWDYGLKVPQIIAMASRGEFPFPCDRGGLVCFPRRKKLSLMEPNLLRQARFFTLRQPDRAY